jgi:uncharacterized protein (DUF433 family)
MKWQERITTNPNILIGRPVIKGTRLSVEFIIDLMYTSEILQSEKV